MNLKICLREHFKYCGMQEMATVDESGLYQLVLDSRKPEARDFRNWVFNEVLPSNTEKLIRLKNQQITTKKIIRKKVQ